MQKYITTQITNHLGFITLNNPEKSNAINPIMRTELITTYQTLNKNPDIRIIILSAQGKNFCAGADLNHMQKMKTVSEKENLEDAQQFAELFNTIYSCEKPTICCVKGKTMGGGLGLLAASDIVIATPESQFCFSEVKIGLIPATIAPYVLQRIGFQCAKYFMLTAELFHAEKALKIGLIDHLMDLSSPDFALLLAQTLLQNNQQAMQETKKWLQALHPITTAQINDSATLLAQIRAK